VFLFLASVSSRKGKQCVNVFLKNFLVVMWGYSLHSKSHHGILSTFSTLTQHVNPPSYAVFPLCTCARRFWFYFFSTFFEAKDLHPSSLSQCIYIMSLYEIHRAPSWCFNPQIIFVYGVKFSPKLEIPRGIFNP
jgi:hypothetical protein